jgi:phosphoglycerate dehydrogenase-like enzyme
VASLFKEPALPHADSAADSILIRSKLPALFARFEGRRLILPDEARTLDDAGRARVRVIVQGGTTPLTAEYIDSYPNLGLVVVMTAGFEGVDVDALKARGIAFRTGVGANADGVAELTVGLVLAAVRGIVSGGETIRSGAWRGMNLRPVHGLSGRKVGIVGLGHIGQATAAKLKVFGCPIAWTGPRPKPQIALPYVASLLDLARESDILIITAHLDDSTHRMINRQVIEALGPQGLLVNVARGGLIDEDEMIAALKEGRLAAAALDVFETEPTPSERWRDVPNVVMTPHVGGVTFEALDLVFDRAAEHVAQFLAED